MKGTAVTRALVCFAIVLGYPTGASAQNDAATDSDVEITADGLYRVDSSIMRGAWAKPELDLRPYTAVFPWSTAVSFRPIEDEGSRSRRRRQSTYPIDEDRQLQITALFREAFLEDLANLENYELWDGPRRGVLMVEGYVLDAVSHIPLDQRIVDDIAADITWEATLVLQIRDSMTDEILARTAERYRERGGFGSSAGSWTHTGQVIRRWSEILCGRLDELSEIGYVP